MIEGSPLKLYNQLISFLVRLLNLLEDIPALNNLSSLLLRYVSITVSLSLELNVDLGLNFSYGNGFSSFLSISQISWIFLQYSSNSVFNFALSILLAIGTNFRPLGKREISASERFFLERLITLLQTNLPSNLSPFYVAILLILPLPYFSSILVVFPALLIISLSLPSYFTKLQTVDSFWLP